MTQSGSRVKKVAASVILRFKRPSLFISHYLTLCRRLMVLADEVITPRLERTKVDDALRLSSDYFFDLHGRGIKLLRKRIGVDDGQQYPLTGRDVEFSRFE